MQWGGSGLYDAYCSKYGFGAERCLVEKTSGMPHGVADFGANAGQALVWRVE